VLLPLRGFGSSRFGLFASGAAQTLAGQLDAMRIVDEAVLDSVGVSGVANDLMPGRQGELGGDDRRPAAVSLLENFEQIMTGAGVEGFEAEVAENEQVGARMAAVASGEPPSEKGRLSRPPAHAGERQVEPTPRSCGQLINSCAHCRLALVL
jgi:hypothetical protein